MAASFWILACLTGCFQKYEAVPLDYLEVWSGGSHLSRYGMWKTVFDKEGTFQASYNKADDITNYPSIQLTTVENEEIWRLLGNANIHGIESSTRNGIPDEVMVTFIYGNSESMDTLKIWQTDARKNDGLLTLLTEIEGLIKKYTVADTVVFSAKTPTSTLGNNVSRQVGASTLGEAIT